MRENEFDIIIIGGGIGGLTLSIQSAIAGFKTAVFEKNTYPFHKVCGEYISNESKNYLFDCGLDINNLNLPQINELAISDIHGNCYNFQLDNGGFGISRFYIDNLLMLQAQKLGVTIFSSEKVKGVKYDSDRFEIITDNSFYASRTAVAAYGKRSNIDVKLQRKFTTKRLPKNRNYIGIKYHVLHNMQNNQIELHNFYNGYCGISKVEEDKCCLCYLTTAENLSNNKNSIKNMEQNILFKNPYLKKIFRESEFLFPHPIAISQINFEKRTQVENHLLMIGDAAGLISPLCGNGMSMAMHSGKIALQPISLFLYKKISRTEMERNYSLEWQKAFGKRVFVGRNIQKLFGHNFTTTQFLKLMHYLPFVSNYLIRQTHGIRF